MREASSALVMSLVDEPGASILAEFGKWPPILHLWDARARGAFAFRNAPMWRALDSCFSAIVPPQFAGRQRLSAWSGSQITEANFRDLIRGTLRRPICGAWLPAGEPGHAHQVLPSQ